MSFTPPGHEESPLAGIDFSWLATDRDGHIAWLVTFGSAVVPRWVEERSDDFSSIERELAALPERGGSSAPDASSTEQWLAVARRGIFAYDWEVYSGPYRAVAMPDMPLTLDELPHLLKACAQRTRLDHLCFQECQALKASDVAKDRQPNSSALPTVKLVSTDSDFQAWVDVVNAVDVWGVLSLEDARNRSRAQRRTEYLLHLRDELVGAACIAPAPRESGAPRAIIGLWVMPGHRRRGLGTRLLGILSDKARQLGLNELEVEAYESEDAAQRFLLRHGFREVARHAELALNLVDLLPPEVKLPPGITLTTRAERPDLLRGMYEVAREAIPDIPGEAPDAPGSFESWFASDIDRPIQTPDLTFIALHGEEVIGYAVLQRGPDGVAFHSLTGVKRAWRGRGIAGALKRTQIAAAKREGFQRLVTENLLDNAPIRHLNATLGYRPIPGAILFRGPLLPAS